MKFILKIFLKYYLKVITKIVLFIHKPVVVAVAGSTNKSFVKKEVKKKLEEVGFSVRANPKNFNTEIGLPLSILYLPSGYNEYKRWIPAILKAPLKIFQKKFPDFLVLSLGSSDKGDMNYLLSIIKPDISIITNITQRYKEGFSDMNNLVDEYQILAKKTRKEGVLVLNIDNYRVREVGENKKQKILYYGTNKDADIFISKIEKNKKGQKVSIKQQGRKKDYQINKFGEHHAYAFAVGLAMKELCGKD
ncbi:MAG: Mur ligase family protein [Patescibacteria group bacterium]|nr:Mur ligase family protein [Patescibacteria group bacterium]